MDVGTRRVEEQSELNAVVRLEKVVATADGFGRFALPAWSASSGARRDIVEFDELDPQAVTVDAEYVVRADFPDPQRRGCSIAFDSTVPICDDPFAVRTGERVAPQPYPACP